MCFYLLKDWSLIRKADFDMQEILWQGLETLVRPTHPHAAFNIAQFQRVRVVENLLVGCQVRNLTEVHFNFGRKSA